MAPWYLLLTRSFDRHRVTVRYDDFDITPRNDPDGAVNIDQGHAWTASYLFQFTRSLRFAAEYLTIDTRHCHPGADCAWVNNGLPETTRENLVQLGLRWEFGL